MVEHPLRERELVGSSPGRAIPEELKMVPVATLLSAHELIVYEGIRRPSVRPSSVLSTFSNDISSEAVRPILLIFHI